MINELTAANTPKEEILKKVSKTKLKYVATLVYLRGHSKFDTSQLLDALIPALEEYNKKKIVYFRFALTEELEFTMLPSIAFNKFAFDVLIDSIYYRAVYKDGYCQVLERAFQDLSKEELEFPDDELSEEIFGLVEQWFKDKKHQAHWIQSPAI